MKALVISVLALVAVVAAADDEAVKRGSKIDGLRPSSRMVRRMGEDTNWKTEGLKPGRRTVKRIGEVKNWKEFARGRA